MTVSVHQSLTLPGRKLLTDIGKRLAKFRSDKFRSLLEKYGGTEEALERDPADSDKALFEALQRNEKVGRKRTNEVCWFFVRFQKCHLAANFKKKKIRK
jgi:hypothetical protein